MEMKKLTTKIMESFGNLPYFYISNLKILNAPPCYLKVAVNRIFKKGVLLRLKRECYVSKSYVDGVKSENKYNDYLEYISSKIYEPSYLSLEYVLYENNVLTESPRQFTLITKNKTVVIRNGLGSFSYHKIKDEFFNDYFVKKRGDFLIAKASLGKALFDFLYLRKNIIMNRDNAMALRLNSDNLSKNDIKVFMKYVKMSDSKMGKIAGWIYDN